MEPPPVFEQLRLMERSPFDGKSEGAGWQRTGQEADGMNSNLCLMRPRNGRNPSRACQMQRLVNRPYS